jgi:hypothetical protein
MSEELIPTLTEWETKYRSEPHFLIDFKRIMGGQSNLKDFLYIEGSDKYFIKDGDNFARYRKAAHDLDKGRAEVTWKIKPVGAKNNINRREINWRVDSTPEEAICAGLEASGYTFDFSIYKSCHIYHMENNSKDEATVVFYTVYDTTDKVSAKVDTFVEIEIDEHLVTSLTEDQAMEIITKYEKILEPLGLNAQRRLKKSLFEIYRR